MAIGKGEVIFFDFYQNSERSYMSSFIKGSLQSRRFPYLTNKTATSDCVPKQIQYGKNVIKSLSQDVITLSCFQTRRDF